MTAHSKTLSVVAAALLLAATALPAAAQHRGGGGGSAAHAGGGGGGSHAGAGGGAHFSGGGAHFRAGGGGGVHVQRSAAAHGHARAAISSHSRATATRTSHRQAAHERQHRHAVAAAEAKHNRAVANREARQNHGNARENRAAARANARQTRQARAQRLQQARQGRFAARFNNVRQARIAHRPYRWAWRHGWYAGFVPWYGWLWWPYAYADIFAYTFWPWGYDPGYWYYAYDDFFDGVYYGDAGTSSAYASAGRAPGRTASVNAQQVAHLCKQPGEGLTAWPTAEINGKLNLNSEQKALFDDLQASGKNAADIFAQSCPRDPDLAITPTGRLEAMTVRLDATLRSVDTVKPALDKFYASLSDEQKQRFNEIGPKNKQMLASRKRTETQGSSAGQDTANTCKDPKPGLTSLPIGQIQDTVHPSEAQQANLKELGDATNQAVSILQNACPGEVPMTPPGRLDAMETRLKAMIEAANTIKPSLDRFYDSLNDEQKARFNKLDRQLSSNG